MEEHLISVERMKLYKKFITTHDYYDIAKRSGYSYSSVNNILNRRCKVTEDNYIVIKEANAMTRERMKETKILIRRLEADRVFEGIATA